MLLIKFNKEFTVAFHYVGRLSVGFSSNEPAAWILVTQIPLLIKIDKKNVLGVP
jgi:hypothetical protein